MTLTKGLSPRLRGNLLKKVHTSLPGGSIPAPAGEPCWAASLKAVRPVYPRACGGTAGTHCADCGLVGLSPRLRGNQHHLRRLRVQGRSIPAPAGEPSSGTPKPQRMKVYPRACGGTGRPHCENHQGHGLSPRLRGNHYYP